jgi:hypothetical protein
VAETLRYQLSDAERDLYEAVTQYVREEMNRADKLKEEGDRPRGNTVGFALTVLQRRLASSPEAILRSLERRRRRLQQRRQEMVSTRGVGETGLSQRLADLLGREIEVTEDGLEELTGAEREEIEEGVVDAASAARTLAELDAEITLLGGLVELATRVRRAGTDKKWTELRSLLLDEQSMYGPDRTRRKIIIFTEHRDTLNYLVDKIRDLLGRDDAVVAIHGGVRREARRAAQEVFTSDKGAGVLVATDAAGEGLNLQRAHLMVNYDLPWNPNRIEQRFGRIHRIGQIARESHGGEGRIRAARFPARKALEEFDFDHQRSPGSDIPPGHPRLRRRKGERHLPGPAGHRQDTPGHRAGYPRLPGRAPRRLRHRRGLGRPTGQRPPSRSAPGRDHQTRPHPAVDHRRGGVHPVRGRGGDLFFQLVSARYEHASMIATSNKPFGRWGEVFGDDTVAAAMIDRLVHHAEVISLKGDSYRLKDRDLGRVPTATTTDDR